MSVPEVSVEQLHQRMLEPNPPKLLDVREPFELQVANIGYDINIPVGSLPGRIDELDPRAEWVVVCRSGGRSEKATLFLIEKGFTNVRNLVGGILAWSDKIDPTVRKY